MDTGTKYERFAISKPSHQPPAGGFNLDSMYIQRVFFGMGRHFDLTPTEALLLATVHSLSQDGNDWCFMSQINLAKALNVSLTTINLLLEKLREAELLEKGSTHPHWKTYRWKLAPKALDRLRYIQAQVAKSKAAKGSRV